MLIFELPWITGIRITNSDEDKKQKTKTFTLIMEVVFWKGGGMMVPDS